MSVRKKVFMALAVALVERVLAQHKSWMTTNEMDIAKAWKEGQISPPVDGRHSFASGRTVRYFFALSATLVDSALKVLGPDDRSIGVVQCLLSSLGFSLLDSTFTNSNFNTVAALLLKQEDAFIDADNLFEEMLGLLSGFVGPDREATLKQFLTELLRLCENATADY